MVSTCIALAKATLSPQLTLIVGALAVDSGEASQVLRASGAAGE